MTARKTDSPQNGSNFRTERMVKNDGQWYFYTREKSMEGPFETKLDAQERLDVYLQILNLNLLSDPSELQLLAI
jgi:hypothetical protein